MSIQWTDNEFPEDLTGIVLDFEDVDVDMELMKKVMMIMNIPTIFNCIVCFLLLLLRQRFCSLFIELQY